MTLDAKSAVTKSEEMQDSHISLQTKQDLISWRRSQALTMYAAGKTMTEIAETLKVDISTISRDIGFIREESRSKQAEYIDRELPFRHRLRVANMDRAITEMWELYEQEHDSRAKKALLDSITDTLLKQAAIDGDPLAIENAIKVVSSIKNRLEPKEETINA